MLPRLNSVFGFSSKTKFRPSSIAVVNVIANGEEGSSQKHKMKRGTEEVTLLPRGQEKHYKLNNSEENDLNFLTSSSTVHLKSRGPTDVVGAILTKKEKLFCPTMIAEEVIISLSVKNFTEITF